MKNRNREQTGATGEEEEEKAPSSRPTLQEPKHNARSSGTPASASSERQEQGQGRASSPKRTSEEVTGACVTIKAGGLDLWSDSCFYLQIVALVRHMD
ncbi:hypothetical protein PsorP6_012003 [Peronosclerospora sorghi]|uniref:Uncharacterized protein n=1 Tax=Peronosclerospora sorghi TaxID=230839 RepID=A0ACC0WKC8_9STRA|nr:hypothetical protein PsorP6_012003 [Peronosclerospora sorghi]